MHDYYKQGFKANPPEEAQNIETLVKFDVQSFFNEFFYPII